MKRFIVALALTLGAVSVSHAHGYRHGHYHHQHHRNYNWVAPAIGGVILGAVIANSQAYQAPVITTLPAPTYAPLPVQPIYYDCLVQVYDPATNTYRNEVRTCVR